MLTLPPQTVVYLAAGATDMRKSFDALMAEVARVLGGDIQGGALFGFCSKKRHMIKILFFDGSGFWIFAKRLAKGSFPWPKSLGDERKLTISFEKLSLILSGVDLREAQFKTWWGRENKDPHVA